MPQDGAGELGEEALDEVEPGAVLGREGKVEAACRPGVEPGSGFPRNVCGMIVEDQLDRGAGRIIDLQNWPTCTAPNYQSCRIQVDGNVGYQTFDVWEDNVVFVQSSLDNNLWLEYGPFGGIGLQNWPTCTSYTPASCRILVDGNIQSFWPVNLNTVFVVGTDYNLWLEFGPFGTVPLPECVYPNSQHCR